jgi:hypothetical protein
MGMVLLSSIIGSDYGLPRTDPFFLPFMGCFSCFHAHVLALHILVSASPHFYLLFD